MVKNETESAKSPTEEKSAPWPTGPLTIDLVQRMIDASFIRYDMLHGHLASYDGAQMLEDLKKP